MKNFCIFSLIALIACTNTKNISTPQYAVIDFQKTPVNTFKKIIIDSNYLNEFDSLKIVNDSFGYDFHLFKLNNQKVGFLTIYDSITYILNSQNNHFKITDSFPTENIIFNYKITDLNNDQLQDVILLGFPNMHGQSESFVLLSNQNKQLIYRKDIKGYNLNFNKKTNFLESAYRGGVYSVHYKMLSKWIGDSLYPFKLAEYNAENSELSYFIFKNNKQILVKKTTQATEKQFDTILGVFEH